MTQYCEDAMEIKENLVTDKHGDEQITANQIGEREYHTHLAVLDEPIYDNEGSQEPSGLPENNQEYVHCKYVLHMHMNLKNGVSASFLLKCRRNE